MNIKIIVILWLLAILIVLTLLMDRPKSEKERELDDNEQLKYLKKWRETHDNQIKL